MEDFVATGSKIFVVNRITGKTGKTQLQNVFDSMEDFVATQIMVET